MAKKFFIGSSVFLLVLLSLWGIYNLFFTKKDTPKTSPDVSTIETPKTEIKKSTSIQVAIDAPVLSPFISSDGDGSILYIDKNTGSLQKFNIISGKKEVLSDITLTSPISAIWKTNGTSAIIKEFRSNEPSFRLISFANSTPPVSLKWGMRYLIWDELENNILYSYQDTTGKITLNRALPDGSDWKELEKLPSTPMFIQSIPKSPLVALWERPANNRLGELKTINITNGETKTLFPGKYGANYLWSPNGEKILLSWAPEKNKSRMTLAMINKNGGEYTDLNFPTLVEKCVWLSDNKTIYCSLPGSLSQTAVMPDDFYGQSFSSSDTFWKIDTGTGKSERIVALEDMSESFDAVNLLVSPDESELFFVNRKDSKLYSIQL